LLRDLALGNLIGDCAQSGQSNSARMTGVTDDKDAGE
jgi:hypothetical protein